MKTGKVLIFSAPSGSGKSTIVSYLLKKYPQLEFSISATSRAPRGEEQNGVEYYFLSNEEFRLRANNGEFIEWEEVYSGSCYGTLRSEVEKIWSKGDVAVFDIDVVGGVNLKSIFKENALSIFIQPPSVEELKKRLILRGTDSDEAIERRVGKAEKELTYRDQFDVVIVNDVLETALKESEKNVGDFISTPLR